MYNKKFNNAIQSIQQNQFNFFKYMATFFFVKLYRKLFLNYHYSIRLCININYTKIFSEMFSNKKMEYFWKEIVTCVVCL